MLRTAAIAPQKACVVCGGSELESTGLTKNLKSLLDEWEAHTYAPFPASVRDDYETEGGRIELYRCRHCLTETFFPLKAGTRAFYAHILQKEEYYLSEKWEFNFAISRILAEGARSVFDYGCGSGYFLSRLTKGRSIRAFGYDFGSEPTGDEVGFVRVTNPTLAALGGAQVDVLCSFQVLEHVADPFSVLREALELLRPGGLAIIAVPDNAGPVRYFPDALTNLPPHHVTRWRKESLVALAERAGLRTETVRFENLPSYLWRMYLPVMLTKGPFSFLGRVANRLGLTKAVLDTLEWMGVRELPGVRGHTVLIIARKP